MDQGNKNRPKKLPSDVSGDGANISSPNFVFVTTTDPTKESDRSTRRRIHQHAMSRIGRSRRTRPRLVQFTYNVRSSGDPGIPIQQPALPQRPDTYGYNTQDIRVGNPNTESTSQEIRPANATPGPVTPLGAGPGVDPFNVYPVPMAREDHELIHHRKPTSLSNNKSSFVTSSYFYPNVTNSSAKFILILFLSALSGFLCHS